MRTRNYKRRSSQPQCCSVRCRQRTALRAATSHVKSAGTADATALFLRASRSIDTDDFSSERPVFCANDETGSHGILEHVVPFVGVALVAAQEMVVKSWLPEGNEFLTVELKSLSARGSKRDIQSPLQSFDPSAQSDFASGTETNKKVHVVRHDHVATDTDTKLVRSATIIDECVVHGGTRKNALPAMRVERHEENRRVEALEDQVQPRWLAFDHSPHRKCCSVRCHQRTSSRGWRPRAGSAETADATAGSAETADAAARSAETADATARYGPTAPDATARSAGDSGRYSSSRPHLAFTRRFA
jgi:hypothetical protein